MVLRVTVFNGTRRSRAHPYLRRRARDGASAAPPEKRRPAAVAKGRGRAPRETILTLDLGARHQPFRAVHLDVDARAFFRGVVVESRVDPGPAGPGEAAPLAWTALGEGAVYR